MNQNIIDIMERSMDRRAQMNDFQTVIRFELLLLASEQGADYVSVRNAAKEIILRSAGKVVS
jgi:hypothetical protein